MLPPSDRPDKPHSILEQTRGPLAQQLVPQLLSGYLLPIFLKKKKKEKSQQHFPRNVSSIVPVQSWEYRNLTVACDTDNFTWNFPLTTFKVSLPSHTAQQGWYRKTGTHPNRSSVQSVYTVILMSVASNTSSIIADTFSHFSRSRPHPILKKTKHLHWLWWRYLGNHSSPPSLDCIHPKHKNTLSDFTLIGSHGGNLEVNSCCWVTQGCS